MPRLRFVDGELVEEPLSWEEGGASRTSSSFGPPVALPENGWSSDDSEARRRRGIDGAARMLRQEVIRQGGADPGADACRDRVSEAVQTSKVTRQT